MTYSANHQDKDYDHPNCMGIQRVVRSHRQIWQQRQHDKRRARNHQGISSLALGEHGSDKIVELRSCCEQNRGNHANAGGETRFVDGKRASQNSEHKGDLGRDTRILVFTGPPVA